MIGHPDRPHLRHRDPGPARLGDRARAHRGDRGRAADAVDPELEQTVARGSSAASSRSGFFLSSVSHDLAHALVARRRGVDVRSIGVSFFGGSTPLDPASPEPGDDVAIAASGPLTSIGSPAVLFGFRRSPSPSATSFSAAAGVLAVLVFLNLLLGLDQPRPGIPARRRPDRSRPRLATDRLGAIGLARRRDERPDSPASP